MDERPNIMLGDYPGILERMKADVRASRLRAALAVNRELISLYWRLGKAIVEQQEKAGWGRSWWSALPQI